MSSLYHLSNLTTTTIKTLSSEGYRAESLSLFCDGARCMCSWSSRNASTTELPGILYTETTDGGTSFPPAAAISDPSNISTNPKTSIISTNSHIGWESFSQTKAIRQIAARTGTNS